MVESARLPGQIVAPRVAPVAPLTRTAPVLARRAAPTLRRAAPTLPPSAAQEGTDYQRLLLAKRVACEEHRRYLASIGLLKYHQKRMKNARFHDAEKLLKPSRSAPTLPIEARRPLLPRNKTAPTLLQPHKLEVQPRVHRSSAPPTEVLYTAAVNRQLVDIIGRGDPLGARLPYTSYYRDHLSASKQRRLLELVTASTPHCSVRDEEQRRKETVEIDSEFLAEQARLAKRERAFSHPIHIDVERLETREDAERREVLRAGIFY